jgi:hypothetical protein
MSVTQTEFHDALLDGARAAPEGLTDARGRPAGRRFDVYRNNVALSLIEALELGFPAVARLVGADRFRQLAGSFLRQHPPDTPMMMQYGAAFPDFLAQVAALRRYGYLPDVARLEQALRTAYHAADAAPADAGVLETLSPDALLATRLHLAPAVRLVRSAWPIHAIWTHQMEDGPRPRPGGQTVLITRPDYDPQMSAVDDGTAAFVAALTEGATLGDAHDRAAAAAPDFDLSGALALLLSTHAISRIDTGDPRT